MAQSTIVGQESSVSASETEPSAGKKPRARSRKGVAFARRFTEAGETGFERVTWELRKSVITNPDGSVVFKMEGAEIPEAWSQLATDIVVSKYFRKAGLNGEKEQGETSVRQVVHRIAHTIRRGGEEFGGYFATKKDADAFEAELTFLLTNQSGRRRLAALPRAG